MSVAADTQARSFQTWRTFKVGGVPRENLLQHIESLDTDDFVKGLIESPDLTASETGEIETFKLTPADLGFSGLCCSSVMLDPAFLAKWSEQNADRLGGYRVELLPPDAGPHIRPQYMDQPEDENLLMGMKPVGVVCRSLSRPFTRPWIFRLGMNFNGSPFLGAEWVIEGFWSKLEVKYPILYRAVKIV